MVERKLNQLIPGDRLFVDTRLSLIDGMHLREAYFERWLEPYYVGSIGTMVVRSHEDLTSPQCKSLEDGTYSVDTVYVFMPSGKIV